jgi:hypothetical protein
MSDIDGAVVNAAVNDLLKNNPALLEGAANHVARLEATPVEVPRKMTPEEVAAEIERISGRAPLTADEQRDIDRNGELQRRQAEYERMRANRETAEAAARVREIFNACQPTPETGN